MNDTFYWFTFADGFRICARGFNRKELRQEEKRHGRLISMVAA